jgi:hypothetical protein
MPNLSNTNYNHVSVKTDSMVKMLEQLAKLGVFKSKPKKRKSSKLPADIRQDNDMVGSVTSLEAEPGRGDPNLFALRQIEPGMSQQEIEDIQERNNAGIAALRAEVAQQRLEDVRQQERFVGGLATAVAGKFGQLESGLANIQSGKFGASSEPTRQSSAILLPDVQEGGQAFTQSLNEGGPSEAPIKTQTEFFAESGEEEGIPTSGGGGQPFQPVQGIFGLVEGVGKVEGLGQIKRGKPTRNEYLRLNGLGPLPPNTKKTEPQTMRDYYDDFSQAFAIDANESLYSSRSGMYKDMVQKLDDLINLSIG